MNSIKYMSEDEPQAFSKKVNPVIKSLNAFNASCHAIQRGKSQFPVNSTGVSLTGATVC